MNSIFFSLSIKTFIQGILVLSVILTLYAYFKEHRTIKEKEKELSTTRTLQLYLIRFFHYFILLAMALYPILTKVVLKNDLIFISLLFLASLHRYLLNGECILTLLEKRIFDPDYVFGSNLFYEHFMVVLFESDKFCNEDWPKLRNLFIITPLIIIPIRYGDIILSLFKKVFK